MLSPGYPSEPQNPHTV